MRKRCYRILGFLTALTVVFANFQAADVFAEGGRAAEQETEQNTEDNKQEQPGDAQGTIVSDESEQASENAAEQPSPEAGGEEQGQAAGDAPGETDPPADNGEGSREMDPLADNGGEVPETKVPADDGRQSWEDANSWRYQNGQEISVQTYAETRQYTTWPDVPGTVARGIDVSQFQKTIDWQTVKNSGVDYVIIRCGYGDNEVNQDDEMWLRNVQECERLDIPYGVYIYSYAMNTTAAKSEAEHVLRLLQGHDPSYPVYLDMENEGGAYDQGSLPQKTLGDIAETFCNIIQNAGYDVGIYANTNWFTNKLTDSRFDRWERWVAQYNETCTYTGKYSMWQCSSQGRVDGISGNVDLNLDFGAPSSSNTDSANVSYQAHVQDIGWQTVRTDGRTAGTTGRSKHMEALSISKGGALKNVSGDIKYRVHVQDIGTQGWVKNGQQAGTTGQNKRIEAVQIALSDKLAAQYDIYYRVHVQSLGWMNWVKGSTESRSWTGTKDLGLGIEAIEMVIVKNGESVPSANAVHTYLTADAVGSLSYTGHQQDYGTLPTVLSGVQLGKTGESRRMEAAWIAVHEAQLSGTIQYRAHVQDDGWQSWVSNGNTAGTTGRSKRMEAIQISLTGELGAVCDVWYRVHVENYGWLGWAKNGQTAGTTGIGYRIEAFQIEIVPKGTNPPGANSNYYKTEKI